MIKRGAGKWGAIAGLAAIVLAVGFVRWPIPAGWVAASLNVTFRGAGLVTSPSGATFRLLPWPSLRLFDARLDTPSGVNLAAAPEARLDLSLGDLIEGRLTPWRALLVNPIVTLDLAGFSGGRSALRAASELAPLAKLTLADGVLRVIDKNRGIDAIVESLQGRIDGLDTNRPTANLTAVWRDAPVQVSASLSDGNAVAAGRASPFAFQLASPVASVVINGELVGGASPALTGNILLAIRSVTGLARILRAEPPSYWASDDVAISAKMKAGLSSVGFSDATITSGGQKAQGALQATGLNGRLAVSGTLDGERLAVAPLFGSPVHAFNVDGAWSSAPFALGIPRGFDLDLRLSAGELDVYGVSLANAAVSAILKDGALSLSVLDATLGGGPLQGDLQLACVGRNLEIGAKAKLADADIGAILADKGWPAPTGQGTAELAVSTRGPSPAAAVAGLKGSAAFTWLGGAAPGVNLEEALRRSQRRSIDWTRELRPGQTAFDRLSLDLTIGDGVVHVARGELASHALTANIEGAIKLASRELDLRVNAAQTSGAGGQPKDVPRLSLNIEGPWSSPTFRAAAPTEGAQKETESP
ncbi:MAG TPA: AsmA-like C-terminal region-containing protein [Roseiarcus sp.]|nr:AsmA-like C-terminal region-containing protein [Roseiarcus sp.]